MDSPATFDIEARAYRAFDVTDTEGRTVSGIAVPYGKRGGPIISSGRLFMEEFSPGAFHDSLGKRGNRVKLLEAHDERRLPLGRIVGMEERNGGLHIEARISDTSAGNDVLTLVRDGALDGFSIGFRAARGGSAFKDENGTLVRTVSKATLDEVSIVNIPAYEDARISSVRAAMVAHQFVDGNGDGTCDICGMTQTEHAAAMDSMMSQNSSSDEIEARADLAFQQEQQFLRLELLRRRTA